MKKLFLFLFLFLFISCSDNKNKEKQELSTTTEIINTDEIDSRREKLRKIYTSHIGIKEVGQNRGSDVYRYQKAAGIKTGMPWCASFVYYCYLESGVKLDIPNPALSTNYFIDKNRIIVIRGEVKGKNPLPGDVIGVSYSKNKVGHVGFYDSENDKFYLTVEGNTRGGKKDPGEGVYRLKRIKRQVIYISNFLD